uniref:Uncharacterized protein n=1 Tax=Hemiselmis andersenii TaxID=464988 RepID=A0A6U5BH51_HEMAN
MAVMGLVACTAFCFLPATEGFAPVAPLSTSALSRLSGIATASARCSSRPMAQGRVAAPLSLRMGEEGGASDKLEGWELWTRPRTTNANWGVFFEVVAKDKDVWVTGLRAGGHSFATYDEYTRLHMRVFTTEGSAVGKELDESAWSLAGEEKDFKLPRVEVGDQTTNYYSLPFGDAIKIPAGSTRAFCIHTDKQRGLALRRKLNFHTRLDSDPDFKEWVDGVTDEGMHFNLVSGLVPGKDLFKKVSTENNARAFAGVVEYDLKDPKA